MPSTPLTCCSIGAATAEATSIALAPGKAHRTVIVGGEIIGNCVRGKLKTQIAPASVMTMDSTEAKIGRSIKNLEITIASLPQAELPTRQKEFLYFTNACAFRS